MSPEEFGIEGSADKYVLWMYDVEHEAFGGGPSQDGDNLKVSQEEVYAEIPEAEAEKKGAALAAEYMDAATGYFLLNRAADRMVLTGELVPASVSVSEWWDYLPANPDGRPMIFSAFAPSTRTNARRMVVDAMGRVALGQITPSSVGLPVSVAGFAAPVTAVRQDWADVFTGDPGDSGHTTQVLHLEWRDENGDVTWDVSALDLREATHLSFRVANAIDVAGVGTECVENESPVTDLGFTVEIEPLALRVRPRAAGEDARERGLNTLIAQCLLADESNDRRSNVTIAGLPPGGLERGLGVASLRERELQVLELRASEIAGALCDHQQRGSLIDEGAQIPPWS